MYIHKFYMYLHPVISEGNIWRPNDLLPVVADQIPHRATDPTPDRLLSRKRALKVGIELWYNIVWIVQYYSKY